MRPACSVTDASWDGQDVSRLGLEPRTPALKGQCSTIELPAQTTFFQRLTSTLKLAVFLGVSFGISPRDGWPQDRDRCPGPEGVQFPRRIEFVGRRKVRVLHGHLNCSMAHKVGDMP